MGDCGKIDTSGLAIETGTNTLTSTADRCNMNCDMTEKYPVCGSDGVTYRKHIRNRAVLGQNIGTVKPLKTAPFPD